MSGYFTVVLRHDKGLCLFNVSGNTPELAAETATRVEHAPMSAVVKVVPWGFFGTRSIMAPRDADVMSIDDARRKACRAGIKGAWKMSRKQAHAALMTLDRNETSPDANLTGWPILAVTV